ncbi:pyridoxal-phosphate dependent enzyme [Nocardioides sp. zg-579]|uniref:Pyridoxal-phosphate dependent enzyme n=1 Tax=Nocardioides marmotae TaxID=2663857 RepID=A0A6I3J021_9ACTN|nr:pyridoxal-phosphate dependent enzyme [Nocardioides marmotae]MCR6030727.1 pyridoxal-phosphate dependent enzyme [Gordonia jinghuaiqii]MTB94361.1 pyridoxal-phosphate dependent enzyme [Nocardioides marmotae]QKE01612.1 pyridoxal-phosphate dependent enzyme [Nocardioides marmotae]
MSAAALPVDRLSMGEGGTPMVALHALAERWGLAGLWAKAEYLNPTGSYKDRIAAESIRVALRDGRRGWMATSSGNGGAAMSAYGARAGLPGVLLVLEDAPAEKLASIAPYGVLRLSMPLLGPDVMARLGEIAEDHGLLLTITAHAHNPEGMRGADGIGEEIAAHGHATHVYVPTGGGGLLVATERGLRAGGSDAAVVVAQPAGCAPIARAVSGELSRPRIDTWETRISGLQLPVPPDGDLALDAVRRSGGWGAPVADEDAWAAQSLLAQTEGIFVEPASALALAAVRQDVEAGRLGPDDQPCVVLTGHGLKDLGRFVAPEHRPAPTTLDEIPQRVQSWLGRPHETPAPHAGPGERNPRT